MACKQVREQIDPLIVCQAREPVVDLPGPKSFEILGAPVSFIATLPTIERRTGRSFAICKHKKGTTRRHPRVRPSIMHEEREGEFRPSIRDLSRLSTLFFFHRNLVDEYLFRFLKRAVAANNATRQFYFIENNCCEVNFVYPDSNRSSS